MRKAFLSIFIVWKFCLPVAAQDEVNKVTIDDCEERLIWLYWSQNYKELAEQTAILLSLDKTYAGRNYFRLGIANLHIGEKQKALEAFTNGSVEDSYFPYNYAGLALLEENVSKKRMLYKKTLWLSKNYTINFYSDKRPENMGLSILLPKSNAWVNHNLGITYLKEEKYDSAQYYFKKASRERPEDAEHLIALAITNFNFYKGQTAKSMKVLKRASKLPNNDYRLACLMAYFEYLNKDTIQSKQYLTEIKSTEANNETVKLFKLALEGKQKNKRDLEAYLLSIISSEKKNYLEEALKSSNNEEIISILMDIVKKDIFSLSPYYNPQIYPAGGYSPVTYEGKKNIKERMFIQE